MNNPKLLAILLAASALGGSPKAEKIIMPKNIIPGGREKSLRAAAEKRRRRAEKRLAPHIQRIKEGYGDKILGKRRPQ